MDDPFYTPDSTYLNSPMFAPQRQSPVDEGVVPTASPTWPVEASIALTDHEANETAIATPVHRIDFAREIDGSYKQLGFQSHNRYLVTQDASGMVIVDQHALHERILYEQIKTKVLSKSLERQQLLVPESVTFGGDAVLVTSYPAMLAKMHPAEMLRQVLEPLMAGGKKPDARDLLDDLMNMIACKAAVKAGDRLSPDEITALLEQRHCYQDTHHCPHGRPTALFFSREQLDKMFKRT